MLALELALAGFAVLFVSWATLRAVVLGEFMVGLDMLVDLIMFLGAVSVSVLGGCITDIPDELVVVAMILDGCIRWICMLPLLFVEVVDFKENVKQNK